MLIEENALDLIQNVVVAAIDHQNKNLTRICQQTLNVIRKEYPFSLKKTSF